ncbi:sugar transporter [Paenibacillus marchantiophytorum]|uniref:Sugar transporter n=1 Tax=Paenibacillus marchantiophytorum TaxID=1619310 RepID=A0ABQ1EMM2_9BACL|nr:BglG family transcription antiterminator [Paenibacillus marchantiophytorum]GFZ78900.1 sugar transporter [Paenibacillus marchantiophytorum]
MLSARQQSILARLLDEVASVTLEALTMAYSISPRTVRHDLLQIEDWLQGLGIGLERNRGQDIRLRLTDEQRAGLLARLNTRPEYLDSERRQRWLLKQLLEASCLKTDSVLDELRISKSTLLSDLAELSPWLAKRELLLIRERGWIKVRGSEHYTRVAYLELLREEITDERLLLVVLGDRQERIGTQPWNSWFSSKDAHFLFDIVRALEKSMEVEFSDASYSALILHLLMAMERLKAGHLIRMNEELFHELGATEEFQTAQTLVVPELERYFAVSVPPEEIGYITQHILGAQKEREQASSDSLYVKLAKQIVIEVERTLGYPLLLADRVVHGLSIHLKPAMYRAKFGLQTQNPLLEQLEAEFGPLVDTIEQVVQEVIQPHGIAFDRNEVGYIALHVSSGLNQTLLPRRKQIAIVCSSGLGTSAILQRRMESLFPSVEIIGRFSYKEMRTISFTDTDAILSTIDIAQQLPVPLLKVSPLLTSIDQENISLLLGISPLTRPMEAETMQKINEILRITERHAEIKNKSELLKELLYMLQGRSDSNEQLLLTDLLPVNSILLQQEAANWEEAIQFSSKLLRERGLTGLQYEEKLTKMIREGKHHFVIGEGIAFPHASSQDGVFGTGFSLVTLHSPIALGPGGQPVWLLITLAASDKSRHMMALSTLLDALNDPDWMMFLKITKDRNDVWSRLFRKEAVLP